MNRLSKIWSKLFGYKVDPDVLNAYRSAIPSTINLDISLRGDSYIATVKSIDHKKLPKEVFLVTEAQNPDSLITMVNDLILSYKDIPDIYRPYYKQILRPRGDVSRTKNLELTKAA